MKNIQVIDGADNCVYDIFAAADEEFDLIFPTGQDVAFMNEALARNRSESLDAALTEIWSRRVAKREVRGIHGVLFYGLARKKGYNPTRRDEESTNPDGPLLRSIE